MTPLHIYFSKTPGDPMAAHKSMRKKSDLVHSGSGIVSGRHGGMKGVTAGSWVLKL